MCARALAPAPARSDTKKPVGKAKSKQLSKDMIGLPQSDFIHAFHIGVSGRDRVGAVRLTR